MDEAAQGIGPFLIVCPSCGAGVDLDAEICVRCGADLQHAVPLTWRFGRIRRRSLNRLRSPDWATAARLFVAAGIVLLCLFGGLGFGFLYLDSVVPAATSFGVGLVAYFVTFAAAGLGVFAGLAARPFPIAASIASLLAAGASLIPAVALHLLSLARGVPVWVPAFAMFCCAAWCSIRHFQQMRRERKVR
jgi:hypothetical protein